MVLLSSLLSTPGHGGPSIIEPVFTPAYLYLHVKCYSL